MSFKSPLSWQDKIWRAAAWEALPIGVLLFASFFGPTLLQKLAYPIALVAVPLIAGLVHRSLWVGLLAALLAIIAIWTPIFIFIVYFIVSGAD